jgi:hypothetical protein
MEVSLTEHGSILNVSTVPEVASPGNRRYNSYLLPTSTCKCATVWYKLFLGNVIVVHTITAPFLAP